MTTPSPALSQSNQPIMYNIALLDCHTMKVLKRLRKKKKKTKTAKTRRQARGENSVLRKRAQVVQGTAGTRGKYYY